MKIRFTICGLIVVLASSVLAGCGGSAAPSEAENAQINNSAAADEAAQQGAANAEQLKQQAEPPPANPQTP